MKKLKKMENNNIMNIIEQEKSIYINDKEKGNVTDIETKNKNGRKKDNLKDDLINKKNYDKINNKSDLLNNDINKKNENKKKNKKKIRQNKEDIEKNTKIEGNEEKNVNRNEKKKNKLNIRINSDNKKNTDNKENNIHPYNLKVIHSKKEENYMPLVSQLNSDLSYKFNTKEEAKENKANRKEKTKKIKGISKENSLKKHLELRPKEKCIEKEKLKIKEKKVNISKTQSKEKELKENNIYKEPKIEKIKDLNHTKGDKKSMIAKKIFFISKNVKSKRPSKFQNISKKLNLNKKINPRKHIRQRNIRMEKMISSKEPKKIESIFAYKTAYLTNNKIRNYTQYQPKEKLNTLNSSTKYNDENKANKENNLTHLRLENLSSQKKNIPKKNNITFYIKDIKNQNTNKIKKSEFISDVCGELEDKKLLNDTQKIKSATFTEGNISININKPYSIKTNEKLWKKYKISNYRQNEKVFGVINKNNLKVPNEIKMNDNNNKANSININNNLNTINTEPSSEFYVKYDGLPKIEHFPSPIKKLIKKIKTKTNKLRCINKSLSNRKYHLQKKFSYPKHLSGIKKIPSYIILGKMSLKPITTSDIIRNHNKSLLKDRGNLYLTRKKNENSFNTKKNHQVIIKNTIINYNMIDKGVILPMKKIKNEKKISSTYNTNILLNRKLNEKSEIKSRNNLTKNNTLNTFDTIGLLNTINNENKYNITINKFSDLYYHYSKPLMNNTNDKNNRKMLINTNSYNIKINSFILYNKFVNTMKNNQKNNKIQFSNIDRNTTYLKDKFHIKNHSMKFNDYFKKNKINSRNIEFSGVNNNTENIKNSSIKNKTVMNSSNRLRSIIHEQNVALPKNKKYTITKGNGCLMKQLRTKGLSSH